MLSKRIFPAILLLSSVGLAQNVVVNPTTNQDIVQPPGTQLQTNNFDGIRYFDASWNWSNAPGGTLTGGTQATITLANCPRGIDTSGLPTGQPAYLIYISGGTGTAEVTPVTGGTCVTGGTNKTVVFTPANSHSGAFTIGSASSGIQEMIVDACGVTGATPTISNVNAHLVLPATGPGNSNPLVVHGSIFVHCGKALLEGDGTLLSCATRDRCMVLGDLVNSNHYGDVTVRGLRFESAASQEGCRIVSTQRSATGTVTITVASGCSSIQTGDTVVINFVDNTSLAYWGIHGPVAVSGTSITYASTAAAISLQTTPGTITTENGAVEDNALPGVMDKLELSGAGNGSFNEGLVIDNDQAATVRNLNYTPGGLLCDANHCGSAVYSVGNTSATPVLWIDKANLSMQCAGNGITVLANNTVRVSDSVIQGFGLWGVNTQNLLGSFGGTQLDNIYEEEGAGPCPSPYGGTAGATFSAAGVIFEGASQPLAMRGGEQPSGYVPVFASGGSTQYNYFIVPHDSANGGEYGVPLFAGYAIPATGTTNVSIYWPHIPPANAGDTVTYDVIRMEAGTLSLNTPNSPVQGACGGGSPTACGSVATALAQCSGLVCTFTDTVTANTSNYAIQSPLWFPVLNYWPGGLVMVGYGGQNGANLQAAFADTDISNLVSVLGYTQPSLFARECFGNSNYGAWVSCGEGFSHGNSFGEVGGFLLNNGNVTGGSSSATNIKGRLNFITTPNADINAPQHIITLVDSNPALTLATAGHRPPNSANDTYIGLDSAGGGFLTKGQLAFGSPVAISNYIGNTGDNASYLERLTATGKTFNVPVAIVAHLNQGATGNFAGTCTMSAGTSCTITLTTSYTSTPGCVVTVQGNTAIAGACSISGTTVTVTAASSNSKAWAAMLFGNPN